ncbi:MAG: ABC transporter permease, partial [Chloroflexi bacterium]|nr:ABC transporter permease [Chloroflexota bacterium]
DRLRGIYMLNPMAGLVESYRRVALTGRPPEPEYLATSTLLSVLIFLLGYAYFKHSEATFADLI